MVDDFTPVRLLPLAEVCPERCNLFGLLGNFQRCLQCGSDKFPNKLRHFPLANIRVAASIRFLHLQPSFFRWMHHPPCGLDLLLLLYRLYRLGQGLTAQVVVQVLVFTIVQRLVKQVPRTSPLRIHRRSVLPCRCQGNCQSVHRSPIGFPPLRDWKRSSI